MARRCISKFRALNIYINIYINICIYIYILLWSPVFNVFLMGTWNLSRNKKFWLFRVEWVQVPVWLLMRDPIGLGLGSTVWKPWNHKDLRHWVKVEFVSPQGTMWTTELSWLFSILHSPSFEACSAALRVRSSYY